MLRYARLGSVHISPIFHQFHHWWKPPNKTIKNHGNQDSINFPPMFHQFRKKKKKLSGVTAFHVQARSSLSRVCLTQCREALRLKVFFQSHDHLEVLLASPSTSLRSKMSHPCVSCSKWLRAIACDHAQWQDHLRDQRIFAKHHLRCRLSSLRVLVSTLRPPHLSLSRR